MNATHLPLIWHRRQALLSLLCVTALAWPMATWADEPAEAAAHALFMQAANTQDSATINAAAEAYTQLSRQHPDDLVLMAYAGAATALCATTTWLPWRKMRFADDGLALLDKALSRLSPAHQAVAYRATPAVLDVQLTAANTFLALPAMFNRRERGLKLLAQLAANPLLAQAPAAFQAAFRAAQQRAQAR